MRKFLDRSTNMLMLIDATGFGYAALFVLYMVVTS